MEQLQKPIITNTMEKDNKKISMSISETFSNKKTELLSTDTKTFMKDKKTVAKNTTQDSNKIESIIQNHLKAIENTIAGYECYGSRLPAARPTAVLKMMKKNEKLKMQVPLAGQYSSFNVIKNNNLYGASYKNISNDVLSEGKEKMTDEERKISKPVDYSQLKQLKEQVMINLSDVNVTKLSDLDMNAQDEILGKGYSNIKNIQNEEFQRKARIQFFIPSKKDRVRNIQPLATSRSSQSNLETVRRAEALNVATDNLFNTDFPEGA